MDRMMPTDRPSTNSGSGERACDSANGWRRLPGGRVVILSERLCENSHGGRKRRYQYHSADRDRGSCAMYERRFFRYRVGIRVFTQSREAKDPRRPGGEPSTRTVKILPFVAIAPRGQAADASG